MKIAYQRRSVHIIKKKERAKLPGRSAANLLAEDSRDLSVERRNNRINSLQKNALSMGIAKSCQDLSVQNSSAKLQAASTKVVPAKSNVVLEQNSRDVSCFLFPYNSETLPVAA